MADRDGKAVRPAQQDGVPRPVNEGPPTIVILMGVSGSGKTTIGTLLARRMEVVFADADDYHSAANKAKMAAGTPLDDADRKPWLDTLHTLLAGWDHAAKGGVLACSALKATYRDTLQGELPRGALRFILLEGSHELIASRLAARHHEYMSAALLDSQIDTLEPPADGYAIVNDRPPEEIVAGILKHIDGEA